MYVRKSTDGCITLSDETAANKLQVNVFRGMKIERSPNQPFIRRRGEPGTSSSSHSITNQTTKVLLKTPTPSNFH